MSISHTTAHKIKTIILKYLTPDEAVKFAQDLLDVPGNKSFHDSVCLLAEMLKSAHKPRSRGHQ